jgi:vitamin B12 transporter
VSGVRRQAEFAATVAVFAALVGAAAGTVRAEEPSLGARASAGRPADRAQQADPTATVSVVEVDAEAGAEQTLDALVLEVPGARARRTGAYGAPSLLSIRGAEPRHNVVLLGDVPLDGVDDGGLDLSTIPAAQLARVEVWRGGAPAWWSAGAIGGLVRLVPRDARVTGASASATAGSFGLFGVQAQASAAPQGTRGPRVTAAAGVTESEGDFPYLDDRGTRFDPRDDVERRRSNARLTQASGLLRLRAPVFGGELDVIALGLGRAGGVPGHALRPTTTTHRTLARALVAAAWTREAHDDDGVREGRVQLALAASHERARFTDRDAQTGLLPRATDDRLTRASLRFAVERRLRDWLALTGVASYRLEALGPSDALARLPNQPSTRHTGAFALEAPLRFRPGGVALTVRPSARVELARASLASIRAEDAPDAVTRDFLVPSARLGAELAAARGLSLSAAASLGARLPTMVELFGDRGWLASAVTLRPERGVGAELGVRTRLAHGPLRVRGEVHAFWREDRDFIRYTRTSQFQAVAQNVDAARSRGLEFALDARIDRRIGIVSALTLQEAIDLSRDRALPLRPAVQLYARASGSLPPFGPIASLEPWVDVTHVGAVAADPSNLAQIPARTVFGCGLALTSRARDLVLAGSVTDLADVRGQDLLGFPLPGRTFAATLTLRTP